MIGVLVCANVDRGGRKSLFTNQRAGISQSHEPKVPLPLAEIPPPPCEETRRALPYWQTRSSFGVLSSPVVGAERINARHCSVRFTGWFASFPVMRGRRLKIRIQSSGTVLGSERTRTTPGAYLHTEVSPRFSLLDFQIFCRVNFRALI